MDQIMDKKTQVFSGIVLILIIVNVIGYFYALYNGNANNISSYSLFIVTFACAGSGFLYKHKLGKFLKTLAILSCVSFFAWLVAMIIQLF